MIPIILRPDQQDIKQRIYNDWNSQVQNVLAVKPTGSGKSIVTSDIVLDGAHLNMRQAVIAHRNELVSQMSIHIANRGIPHRIIGSDATVAQITRQHRNRYGRSFVNVSAQTAVVGVDTLVARREKLLSWTQQTDRWIIDEAHHVLQENKWGKAVTMFPNAHGLGVTATPQRADGMGLGREYDGVFDTMQIGLEMRQCIENGALADFEIVCPKSDIEIEGETTSKNGDWSARKLKVAAKKSKIVGDVVKAYCQYAYMKQAICFATDVETAGDIANKFNEANVRAASLSAKTNTAVREKYIQEFRDGTLQILVNVDLFDEGFDVPACEVTIMARPTASLGKYRQMAGRCLRTAENKPYGLIIDHVSNVTRHGLPDKYIAWTLARADKRGKHVKDPDEIELTVCKHCTKPYEKFHLLCPYCGLAPPLPEPRDRTIDMVDGDLVLLDRKKLDQMRRAMYMENPADVGQCVRAAAGDGAGKRAMDIHVKKYAAHEALREAIAQWAAIQREAGFEDREIHKKFYLTTGTDVLTALDGSRTRQEYEKLTETVKGWYLK